MTDARTILEDVRSVLDSEPRVDRLHYAIALDWRDGDRTIAGKADDVADDVAEPRPRALIASAPASLRRGPRRCAFRASRSRGPMSGTTMPYPRAMRGSAGTC